MNSANHHFLDILLRHIREAGFQDGIDFKLDEGLQSMTPILRLWLKQNGKVLLVKIQKEMGQRGFKLAPPIRSYKSGPIGGS